MSAALTLVIGNKNYSSWSMRPWIALRGAAIEFRERMLKFDSQDWRDHIGRLSPSGMVPVLWEGEPGAGFATWDTLAIIERAHELFPAAGVWPKEAQARARARSICAEMHAGFRALRAAMPVNIRGRYPGEGMNPEVAKDIERIASLWTATRKDFARGGPYLCGAFSAADAYYAPVATRFRTYGVDLARFGDDGTAQTYANALLSMPQMAAWTEGAIEEVKQRASS